MNRHYFVSIVFYIISVVTDIYSTYIAIQSGNFYETNPILAGIIFTPIHQLMEIITFLLLVALSIMIRKHATAKYAWIAFIAAGVVRLYAGIHNMLLYITGYEIAVFKPPIPLIRI